MINQGETSFINNKMGIPLMNTNENNMSHSLYIYIPENIILNIMSTDTLSHGSIKDAYIDDDDDDIDIEATARKIAAE